MESHSVQSLDLTCHARLKSPEMELCIVQTLTSHSIVQLNNNRQWQSVTIHSTPPSKIDARKRNSHCARQIHKESECGCLAS